MADGRVPSSDTSGELIVEKMVWDLNTGKLGELKVICVRMPGGVDVTGPDNHTPITRLYPDRLVHLNLMVGADNMEHPYLHSKALLFHGWAFHKTTAKQETRDDKKNVLYNAAGYRVVEVGDYWIESEKRKAELIPKLRAALVSPELVVDLAS